MPVSAASSKPHGGALEVQGVRRYFGDVVALDNVSLQARAGEFFSLLGPSGCGKTTLLRIIAGLDEPNAGTVSLDGADLLRMPAHERPVNTVFQSYALFPHLTVADNVAFGLRMKKTPAAETKRRVGAMMELVEVDKLAARKPHELSGGQRQRVALARALVNEPRVLLLDEPLAAVDQKLRKQLQSDLFALQRRLGLTFIYVTHDQEEALSLSDRLAVLDHGRVEQVAAPREVYERPATRFVAEFLGSSNLIPAEVDSAGVAHAGFGQFHLPSVRAGKATLFFRPEQVVLGHGPFAGIVEETTFSGLTTRVTLRSSGDLIRAVVLTQQGLAPRSGDRVLWNVPVQAVTVF